MKVRFDKYEACGAYHWRECDKKQPGNIYNPALEARYRVLVNKIIPSERLMDVGCGDGYLLNLAHKKFREAVGVEYEESGVKLARKMLSGMNHISIHSASCYDLTGIQGYFDCVTMADVIEHLDEPHVALE